LPAAGWFGFGPGTFSIVFPFLLREHGVELDGILRYAHQDYLQTLLEWGTVGFALWAMLVGGGIARVAIYLWRGSAIRREHALGLALTALSIFGVLIHSLIDFPLQIASLQLITAVLLGQLWVKLPRHQVLPQLAPVECRAFALSKGNLCETAVRWALAGAEITNLLATSGFDDPHCGLAPRRFQKRKILMQRETPARKVCPIWNAEF
jgi:O-antigen ligase